MPPPAVALLSTDPDVEPLRLRIGAELAARLDTAAATIMGGRA